MENQNIESLNLPFVRSKLGIVSQEPVLFDRTIAENIQYGDNQRSVSMEEVRFYSLRPLTTCHLCRLLELPDKQIFTILCPLSLVVMIQRLVLKEHSYLVARSREWP